MKTPFNQIGRQIEENGVEILPITLEDAMTLSSLPFHHRDPFDRIIIVQCFNNGFGLISKDKNFDLYKVKVIW